MNSNAAGGGINTNSILYKNFNALKQATGANAVDLDIENGYDPTSIEKFCYMLNTIGYKISISPYDASYAPFWKDVVKTVNANRPGAIDQVNLQCYSGGGNNSPCSADYHSAPFPWDFSGVALQPGLTNYNSSAVEVQNKIAGWVKPCGGLSGAFLFIYDGIQKRAATYATAISNGLKGIKIETYGNTAGITNNSIYKIVSSINGTSVLDVLGSSSANGSQVQLYSYNGTDAQKWRVISVAGGYKLVPQCATNSALDVTYSGSADGTQLEIYQSNNTSAQIWQITPDLIGKTGVQYYKLSPACAPGSSLDDNNLGTADGNKIQIWQSTSNNRAQNWAFVKP